MAIGSDYYVQQLIAEVQKSSNELSEMKKLLIHIAKAKPGSGSGGNSGNGSGNKPKTNILGTMFNEMKGFGRFSMGNNVTVPNTVRAIGTSASVLSKSFVALGGPVGAAASVFANIVEAGMAVYDFMQKQLELYEQINSSGITLNNGIIDLRKSSASAFMSVDQFSKVIKSNSDVMASLEDQYGDGVEHFGKLVQQVQLTQESMGLYGVSQEQIADITAKNLKIQKLYSSQAQLRDLQETSSTQKFIGDLTYMSKVMGTSVDELLKKVTQSMSTARIGSIKTALKNYNGLPDQLATQVTQSITTAFQGFNAGPSFMNAFSQFMNNNSISDDYIAGADMIGQLFNKFKELGASGVTDVKEYQRVLKEAGKNPLFMQQMENRIQSMQATFDPALQAQAENLQQLQNAIKMMNDPKYNPRPALENLMNRFNLWIGKSVTEPFLNWMNGIAESFSSYLTEALDSTDSIGGLISKVFSDGMHKIFEGISSLFDYVLIVPKQVLSLIGGENWATKIMDNIKNLFVTIMDIPVKLVSFITSAFFGSDKEARDSAQSLKSSVSSFFTQIGSFFTLDGIDFSADSLKKRVVDAYNTVKESISNIFNKVVGWFSGDDKKDTTDKKPATNNNRNPATQPKNANKTKTPPVSAKPEKSESEPVKADNDTGGRSPVAPDPQQQINAIQEALNALNKVTSNTADIGSLLQQVNTLLRQISDNTEPEKNL